MESKNLVIIMSDQHNPKMLGCYGHEIVKTPNIDALAARGTLFTDAYTTCPVCVPARASFATGKYIHQTGHWDNAIPYDGSDVSWHHLLRERGHQVVSIGKLHFRSEEDDNGFSEEIMPMNIIEGVGDLLGLVRDDMPKRGGAWKMAGMAGPGESSYTRYDRDIASKAQVWLHEEAPKYRENPWVLFVSFVCPHYPLTAPPEFYYPYYYADLPWPKLYDKASRPHHPYAEVYRQTFNFDDYFDEEGVHRALAGYFGLCSFLDHNVGKVVNAVQSAGLADSTRIMHLSDHGDNLGARGLWGKSTMYEESVGIPLIIAGPDIPSGSRSQTPVSFVDTYPFIMECVGEAGPDTIHADHLGVSLFDIARGLEPERNVLSEYHGMGSETGVFMIRDGRYKYVHYVAYEPELFDLENDPEELTNLAEDPAFSDVVANCEAKLRSICNPEEIDARAKREQRERLEKHGGREVVIARGDLGFSVPPGTPPDFS